MSHVSDLKLRALRNALSTAVGNIDDLERQWLIFAGATGDHIQTLWYDYLVNVAANPVAPRHLNDMFYEWLGLLGFTGAMDDRFKHFWENYGTYPTEFIDFQSRQSFAPFTFTRVGNQSDLSDAGIITQKTTNVPAYYKSEGLVIEESRTNAITFSEDFTNAIYTQLNCTVSANAGQSPSGLVDADSVLETATPSVLHEFSTAADLPSTGDVNVSIFVKSSGRRFIKLSIGAVFAGYDLTNGNLSSASPYAYSDDIGNGWYRISLAASNVGVGVKPILTFLDNSFQDTYTGDTARGYLFWGMQVATGLFPTTYIPTNGATATRSPMLFTRTSASLPGFTLNNFAMEVRIQPMYQYSTPHALSKIISLRPSGTVRFEVEFVANTDQIQVTRTDGVNAGFVITPLGAINYQRGQSIKIHVIQSSTVGLRIIIDDFITVTDSSAAAKAAWGVAVPTTMALGMRDINALHMNSFLRYFKYWNTPTLF